MDKQLWCPLTKEHCWGKECACAVASIPNFNTLRQWSCGLVHLDDYSFAQEIDCYQKKDR